MIVFSYDFFILWAITLLLYYTLAKKWQWELLLIGSIMFYILSISDIPWLLMTVWVVTYAAGNYVNEHKDKKGGIVCYCTVLICVVALFGGRMTSFLVTLGNSYFTLKAIGYVVDAYRDKESEHNIFKYLLYLIFWPTILEGPFNRIDGFLAAFDNTVTFDYVRFTHGVQRFVWGTFKKLVIAERLSIISSAVLSSPSEMGGGFVIIGVIAYAIQLYADFSGFMDMMLGIGMTFGISLPENFRQPYFSKSIPEFWRRWHITLGAWFRDYVMFPFTSSKVIKGIAKRVRKKNKTIGKLIPLILGTCLVWVLTGLWHGFSKNYLLWGCYYALLMCVSQVFDAIRGHKEKQQKNVVLNGIGIAKTIVLVIIADTLVCVPSLNEVRLIGIEIFHNLKGGDISVFAGAGVTKTDAIILSISIVILLVVSVFKEKGKSIQEILDASPTIIRWGVYYVLVYSILMFGLYDAQYDASRFMYMQF